MIKFHNLSKSEYDVEYQIYMLTSSGIELLKILPQMEREDYIIKAVNAIKEKCQNGITLELHKVNYMNGNTVNYFLPDLLKQVSRDDTVQ